MKLYFLLFLLLLLPAQPRVAAALPPIHVRVASIDTNYNSTTSWDKTFPVYLFNTTIQVNNYASEPQELSWDVSVALSCVYPFSMTTTANYSIYAPRIFDVTCSAYPHTFQPGLTTFSRLAGIGLANGSAALPDGNYTLKLADDNGQSFGATVMVSNNSLSVDYAFSNWPAITITTHGQTTGGLTTNNDSYSTYGISNADNTNSTLPLAMGAVLIALVIQRYPRTRK